MTQLELRFTPDYKLTGKEILKKRFLLDKDKTTHSLNKKLSQVVDLLSIKIKN